jgi:LMBR1 domain-containing protein 1
VLGRPLVPFLNEMLIGLDNGNAGFLATGIFFYLCLYLVWCVQKGTVKFGMRLPGLCRFHPMREGETWLNSFLFNVILMLVASVGVVELCISSFPTYTRQTEIYAIVVLQLNYMKFYSLFYQNHVFPVALVIWAGIALIYMLVTCNKKPPYMQDIERIRNHHGEEDFST